MKTAIIIISDPKSGTDEALGRLLNALVLARECAEQNEEVAVVFSGPGTRWPEELVKPAHPANGLYDAVREHVRGASCGCAHVFGATAGVEACGVPLISEYAVPGTPPVASIRALLAGGWNTLVF